MRNVVFDMETGDPDDFLTLVWLLGHPRVNLKAVTVTPGGQDQIALVRWALRQFDRLDIPVGAYLSPDQWDGKQRVSSWHYKVFGDIDASQIHAEPGWEILYQNLDSETALLTGAPLKNLGALLRNIDNGDLVPDPTFEFPWTCQGGFAGDNIVEPKNRLPQFAGKITCPTYNLNGDVKSALRALAPSERVFTDRRLVSKNVCHGVFYDRALHERVQARLQETLDPSFRLSLSLIYKGMDRYLDASPEGKKFHDPLAAVCMLNPAVATWSDEVEVYRERGEWGCRPCPGSGVRIIISYDRPTFERVFLAL